MGWILYSSFNSRFYLFVKIASLKYGLLNTLANTKSRYANDKVSYERKSVFCLVSKRAWTIFKFLYGSLECWAWSDSFVSLVYVSCLILSVK